MKKDEKVFPISTTIFWSKTVIGIFWIGTGLTGMFDNLICNILNILFLLAAIASLTMTSKIYRAGDDGDEMSETNYTQAKANAGNSLYMILCVTSITPAIGLDFIQELDFNWSRVVCYLPFILMGIYNLLTGLYFRQLEAE